MARDEDRIESVLLGGGGGQDGFFAFAQIGDGRLAEQAEDDRVRTVR